VFRAASLFRAASHPVRHSIFALISAGLFFGEQRAVAQYNTAEIDGIVKDAQGGVLPGATVTAAHLASGQRVVRITDEVGRFFLPALQVGEFTLSVELEGFRPFTQTGIVLRVGQKVEIPVTLSLGGLNEAVTITAEAPLLQTANAEISDVIANCPSTAVSFCSWHS